MRRNSILLGTLSSTGLMLGACSGGESPAPTEAASKVGEAPYTTALDLEQVMNWVMDPHADIVFAAVATIITEHGEEKIEPKTDEQWNAVRNSAAVIVESGNLLMLPGRGKNEPDWNEKAKALSSAAQAALQATDVKDADELFAAAGDMYEACSACHARYVFTEADGG